MFKSCHPLSRAILLRLKKILLHLFLGIFPTSIVLAQAGTSAGQLLQEIQSQQAPAALPAPEPKIAPSNPTTPAVSQGVRFTVKRFVFEGATKVATSDLERICAAYTGRPITYQELDSLKDQIGEYYRNQGWLVRVFFPKQDITDGTVRIVIVEARLGDVGINNESERVANSRVKTWIYSHNPKGEILSLDDLDRSVLLLNDLPDVSVPVSTLKEGLHPGETILDLTVADKPLGNLMAAVDNYGDNSTGKVRETANLVINAPLGFGEQVSLYGLNSEGSSYGRLAITTPVGSDGLRVGINGSFMNYRVINPSFTQLWANGNSSTGGLEASYPLIRTRPTNLVAIANWSYSDFKNWSNGVHTAEQNYSSSVGQLGLSANHLDSLLGGGINTGSLIISIGKISRPMDGQYNQQYGVGGNFTKLRYAFNRNQTLAEDVSLYLAASGQVASKNMDSSEQLYLGGPFNVRAYATGEGASTQGNLLTAELRQKIPYDIQLTAFYDYGNVQAYKSVPATYNYSNSYILQGYGLGVDWKPLKYINLKAVWAHRVGGLPSSVMQYFNSNGGTSPNRLWLGATLYL